MKDIFSNKAQYLISLGAFRVQYSINRVLLCGETAEIAYLLMKYPMKNYKETT